MTDGPTSTGHEGADAAIERLRSVESLPVEEHAGVYEQVHEELRELLASARSAANGHGTAS